MTADVALTLGDGIGPEIAIKAASRLAETGKTSVVLVGDPHVIHHCVQRLAIDRSLAEFSNGATRPGALSYLPIERLPEATLCPGQISAEAGQAAADYVSAAIRFVEQGYVQSIAACPHSETSVNAAGIPFSGYPSLLARLNGIPEDHVFLMLAGAGLRVVHVTLDKRLQTALARISRELVDAQREPPLPPCKPWRLRTR